MQVPQRARNDALIKLRKFLETNLNAVEAFLRKENEDAEEVIDELRRILRKDGEDQV
jgi:LytS/YehU family sensor histidine kinase